MTRVIDLRRIRERLQEAEEHPDDEALQLWTSREIATLLTTIDQLVDDRNTDMDYEAKYHMAANYIRVLQKKLDAREP